MIETIIAPYIEKPFKDVEVISKENAIKAMEKYRDILLNGTHGKWIDIKDNPPPDYHVVLYYDAYEGRLGVGYFVWSQSQPSRFTHWMELPTKPL